MTNKFKGFKFIKPSSDKEVIKDLRVAWIDKVGSLTQNTLVLTNNVALYGVKLLKMTKVDTEASYTIVSKEIVSKKDGAKFLVWEVKA